MDTLTIADLTVSEWGLILVFSGFTVGSLFLAGLYACQLAIRLAYRDKVEIFRSWHAEGDLFIPTFLWMYVIGYCVMLKFCLQKSAGILLRGRILFRDNREPTSALLYSVPLGWFIFETVLIAAIAAYLSVIAFRIVDVLTEVYSVSGDILRYAIVLGVVAFTTGLLKEFVRTNDIKLKIDKLTGLHPRYLQFFSRAEMLSIYEILRSAPDWLWEEYSKLEKWQINENTNRKYRELAAPYQHREIRYFNKTMILIMIIALMVAIIAATVDLSGTFWNPVFHPAQ